MLTESEIIIRLLLAAGLGAVIGFERERAHKVAGLRTHALVAIGAALLSVISIHGFDALSSKGVYDPSRIISNIIVGIGFIGGGAILRQGPRIIGTTTAATLWLVSAVGIAAGMGLFYVAVTAAAIGYGVLTLLWQVEEKVIGKVSYKHIEALRDDDDAGTSETK
ncbi:MAG: MgtC/SapB family protein [Candidatus Paceibacterota bacterium]